MSKFLMTTLGCKVNQYESEVMAEELKDMGWEVASEKERADIHIINTCAVTQKASMQSRQAVRQAVRCNPNARIIVTGCYARVEPDELRAIEGVDEVRDFGFRVSDFGFRVITARTRPFLKIQDGCNAFCTYCIVPYARGRSRSMPPDDVLENIRSLKDAGFHEVVLTGIHLGCYGLDLSPRTSLYDLLCRICDDNAISRVRLSSVEPNELTREIVALTADSPMLCNHFHVPLQSGDDTILKRMGRPYTNGFFRDLVMTIREQIPDAAIGVDTLIGFPGENETAYENTRLLIKELPVTYLHVFPFSSRKGTPASTFPDKIPPQIIKARAKEMRRLGLMKKHEFYKGFIGRCVKGLVETSRDRASELLKGITSNYIPVLTEGGDELMNTFVNLSVSEVKADNTVFGVSKARIPEK